jgi:ABC-2 type transport system ATP-binding protein
MQLAHAQDKALDGPAIEVRALRKVYRGGVEAVKGIDFVVAPGEVFGLLGPNGAGKSTTIGMLTTTIVPTSGCAWLAGYDVVKKPRQARSLSSVVFQEAVVDGGLSGRANFHLHARLWGVPAPTAATRIDDLIEAFGIAELIDRPVESFSGGQRRRLEIARLGGHLRGARLDRKGHPDPRGRPRIDRDQALRSGRRHLHARYGTEHQHGWR